MIFIQKFLLVLICLTILFLGHIFGDYDDSLARNKLYPLASTSYGTVPEKCVKNLFNNSEFIRQITVVCDKQNDTCSGFVAVSHDDMAIILVFRGTNSDQELMDETQSTFHDSKVKFIAGGMVNAWFNNAFNLIWQSGMRDAFLTLKNQYPTYDLWITGHSLGGAEASLCAAWIIHAGYVSTNKTFLYTFGQPRVGDQQYAQIHDLLVKNSYRVVHAADKVALNPPQSFNYTHHKTEVWYNNNMVVGQPFKICQTDEDKNCSDSVPVANETMVDHFIYFDRPFNYTKYGCPNNTHRVKL